MGGQLVTVWKLGSIQVLLLKQYLAINQNEDLFIDWKK